jgi:LPXTG-site transpeptidase (sortase) family protein
MRGAAVGIGIAGSVTLGLIVAPYSNSATAPGRDTVVTSSVPWHVVADARRSRRQRDDSPAPTKSVWARPKKINLPLGTLRIPAIRLQSPIRMGIDDRVVKLGPGLWPGTSLPGKPGNAVLAGHRTTHTHPFEDLDRLHRGDAVFTKLRSRHWIRFKVFQKKIVPEARYARFVLRQPRRPGARLITLFACTPKGYRSHRIVVRAKARRINAADKEDGHAR